MQFHLKHDSKIFTQKGEQLENHKEKQTSKTQYDQNYFTQVRFNSYKTWICKHYIYKVGKPPTWCKTIISQDKNGRICFSWKNPAPPAEKPLYYMIEKKEDTQVIAITIRMMMIRMMMMRILTCVCYSLFTEGNEPPICPAQYNIILMLKA